MDAENWRINVKRDTRNEQISDGGELDEVVIGSWFHLEKMDDNRWWMRIGKDGVEVNIVDGVVSTRFDKDRY